jgi:hypothetical protein
MKSLIINAGDPAPSLRSFKGDLEFTAQLLQVESYGRVVCLTLLDNALLRGATVPTLQFSSEHGPKGVWKLISAQLNGLTAENLREYVLEIERRHPLTGRWDVLQGIDGQRVFRTHIPGSQVFHARFLHRIPRLMAIPERWTLMHVKQALANGQFRNLRCDGQYSDDYKRDAMNNNYERPLDAIHFLERLVSVGAESGLSAGRSGWGTTLDRQTMKVYVSQHNFDNNSFTLVL